MFFDRDAAEDYRAKTMVDLVDRPDVLLHQFYNASYFGVRPNRRRQRIRDRFAFPRTIRIYNPGLHPEDPYAPTSLETSSVRAADMLDGLVSPVRLLYDNIGMMSSIHIKNHVHNQSTKAVGEITTDMGHIRNMHYFCQRGWAIQG